MTSCFEFTAVPARPLVYPINLSLACVNKKNKTKMAGKKKKKKKPKHMHSLFLQFRQALGKKYCQSRHLVGHVSLLR